MKVMVFDVGGTGIKYSVMDEQLNRTDTGSTPTPADSQEHFLNTLREIYLTGFEIVVKEAKPKTIMSSYNLINGTYANENAHLLKDILRKDWGFEGAVVTDWGGSNDHALGVKNGSTLEMPFPGDDSVRELMKAVESGKISEADVDARLDELLELVLDTKAAVEAAPRTFDADAHHALAHRAAAESVRRGRASFCSRMRAVSCL